MLAAPVAKTGQDAGQLRGPQNLNLFKPAPICITFSFEWCFSRFSICRWKLIRRSRISKNISTLFTVRLNNYPVWPRQDLVQHEQDASRRQIDEPTRGHRALLSSCTTGAANILYSGPACTLVSKTQSSSVRGRGIWECSPDLEIIVDSRR
jgi:hypothetical protein